MEHELATARRRRRLRLLARLRSRYRRIPLRRRLLLWLLLLAAWVQAIWLALIARNVTGNADAVESDQRTHVRSGPSRQGPETDSGERLRAAEPRFEYLPTRSPEVEELARHVAFLVRNRGCDHIPPSRVAPRADQAWTAIEAAAPDVAIALRDVSTHSSWPSLALEIRRNPVRQVRQVLDEDRRLGDEHIDRILGLLPTLEARGRAIRQGVEDAVLVPSPGPDDTIDPTRKPK